jgi:prophage endopeptidase
MCLLLSMAWAINHYRDNATTYKDQRDKETVRAEASEAITNNVITAMNLIRDISQATQNAKNELAQKGETRIVYIRQALEGDPCASQLVPAAAADSLREYADSLRPGSGSADKR